MFLLTNNLFSSKSILMRSLKRLWEREKDGSCFRLVKGIFVCRLRLETDLEDSLEITGGVLVSLRRWSISANSVSIVSRYLEE